MTVVSAFRRDGDRFVLRLGADERAMLGRLLDELKSLLAAPAGSPAAVATTRLFPVVHPDDDEMEAEYQRLMRDELVASRLAAIEAVERALATPTTEGRRGRRTEVVTFDEESLVAFMQAVNSIRLVLGTILDVSEDDDPSDHVDGDAAVHAPEYHLYAYLSWVLDSAVASLSPDPEP